MSQTDRLLKFFTSDHLEGPLAAVAHKFEIFAKSVGATLPDGPEKTVALRKLLEAKDCAVRAQIEGTANAARMGVSPEAFERGSRICGGNPPPIQYLAIESAGYPEEGMEVDLGNVRCDYPDAASGAKP